MNKEREGGQTSSRADETVSNIAPFPHGAETCSVEGPNQEPSKNPRLFSGVHYHKLHELISSVKEKEEIFLVPWVTEATLCLGTGEEPPESFWVRISCRAQHE